MLEYEKEIIARARRLSTAQTDFDRRACVGQLYPETAHTMTMLDLYGTLHGMSKATLDGLIHIIEFQDKQRIEMEKQLAEQGQQLAGQAQQIKDQRAELDLLHGDVPARW